MDYYKVLQVDPEAEEEVIKAAYKRLSAKYHPDRNGAPDATERMARINAAHDVLGDAERREAYDYKRRAEAAARPATPSPQPVSRPTPTPTPASPPGPRTPRHAPQHRPASAARLAHVDVVGIVVKTFLVGLPVVLFVAHGVMRRERAEARAAAAFDVRGELAKALESSTTQCAQNQGYEVCSCFAELTKARFDHSPLAARTLAGANREFLRRLDRAGPRDGDLRACERKLNSRR